MNPYDRWKCVLDSPVHRTDSRNGWTFTEAYRPRFRRNVAVAAWVMALVAASIMVAIYLNNPF